MSKPTAAQLVSNLSQDIHTLLKTLIPGGAPVAHVWYEESVNFGDSAIWCGQKTLLQNLGINPVYECSDKNYNEKIMADNLGQDGVILLRGGGNFGDLYSYHKLRLKIIQAFPEAQIIQLPQTAKFQLDASLENTRIIISACHDITLLARDAMTYRLFNNEFGGRTGVKVMECPDMAFASGIYNRTVSPGVDIVCLLRTDSESNYWADKGKVYSRSVENDLMLSGAEKRRFRLRNEQGEEITIENTVLTDGNGEIEATDWYLCSLASPANNPYFNLDYLTKAKIGVMTALGILSRGKVVITDRLHGYILCLQMGIPHVVVDNSYGKLSSFYETWGKASGSTYFAGSIPEALDLARKLAAGAE